MSEVGAGGGDYLDGPTRLMVEQLDKVRIEEDETVRFPWSQMRSER